MKIIGLTGKKGSGKDTVADYLVKHHGFVKLSFAAPLKEICSILFGFTESQMNDHTLKETVDSRWGVSPRQVLQFVGTSLFRNGMEKLIPEMKDNFWIEIMKRKIEETVKTVRYRSKYENDNAYVVPYYPEKIVITDIRFDNEAKLVYEYNNSDPEISFGNRFRSAKSEIWNISRRVSLDNTSNHITEFGISEKLITRKIDNNGTLEDLHKQLEELI